MTDEGNRDGDDRSHPIEIGTGAAAAGLVGAGIGMAAGPVGMGLGAAVGAITGGIAGETVGKAAHEAWDEEGLRQLIGYHVVDRDDERIGTVSAIWDDGRGDPSFIGIRTGWLGMGRTHIVPAQSVAWSARAHTIRLPFSVQAVKDAPTFDQDERIDPVTEGRIYTYYQQHGFRLPRARQTEPPPTATVGEADEGEALPAPRDLGEDGASTIRDTYEGAMPTPRELDEGGASPIGEAHERAEVPTPQAADAPPPTADGAATTLTRDERVIPLREEELVVGKRQVDAGGVRLRKIVRTEIVNQPVEVRREDVVIERVPASGASATRETASFEEEDVYVPLRREEAVVGKRTRTREEVRVRKTEQLESQQVSEQLRSEDVQVDRSGASASGQTATTVDPYRDDRLDDEQR